MQTRAEVLGLLGGVASGKTFVARVLAEAGLVVLDADEIAREVLATPELRRALLDMLGEGILKPDGSLDRSRIAARVFGDDEARRGLEALSHPEIRRRLVTRMEEAVLAGKWVVLDAPLLLESGLIERCDHVVFLDVPAELRRERALARGMSPADWQEREAAQADLQVKRSRADFVIGNEGGPEVTRARIRDLLTRIRDG
ncbi:MAG: dephospho-CoA kinase [Planctomycetota bacterium]